MGFAEPVPPCAASSERGRCALQVFGDGQHLSKPQRRRRRLQINAIRRELVNTSELPAIISTFSSTQSRLPSQESNIQQMLSVVLNKLDFSAGII